MRILEIAIVVLSGLILTGLVLGMQHSPGLVARWSPFPGSVIIAASHLCGMERDVVDYRFCDWGRDAYPAALAVLKTGDSEEKIEALHAVTVLNLVDPTIRREADLHAAVARMVEEGPWTLRGPAVVWIMANGADAERAACMRWLEAAKKTGIPFEFRCDLEDGMALAGISAADEERLRGLFTFHVSRHPVVSGQRTP